MTHEEQCEEIENHNDARLERLEKVIFGQPEIKEMGMKEKVDKMYDILVQANGIRGLFGLVVLVGATLTILKMWLTGKS